MEPLRNKEQDKYRDSFPQRNYEVKRVTGEEHKERQKRLALKKENQRLLILLEQK